MATDDEILALLKEIRDTHQQHLELYRTQSQRSITMSTLALRRQRFALLILVVILGGIFWFTMSRSDSSEWKAIMDRNQQQLDQWDRQMQQHKKELL